MESSIYQRNLMSNESAWTQQTELVTTLLAIDEWATEDRRPYLPELDEIREFNRWAYNIEMPEGRLVVTEGAFHTLVEDYEQKLAALQATQAHASTTNGENIPAPDCQLRVVSAATEALDDAKAFKQTVFSWWAVPYWLAQKLIEKQEVILLAYGNCWWGITDPSALHPATTSTIRTIYEELQIAKLTNPTSNDDYHITRGKSNFLT